jgi:hypothetical protein
MLISHNMQSNTLTRQEYKGKIFVRKYSKKFMKDPGLDFFGFFGFFNPEERVLGFFSVSRIFLGASRL